MYLLKTVDQLSKAHSFLNLFTREHLYILYIFINMNPGNGSSIFLLIVVLLYACKLAFLALSTCVKIILYNFHSKTRLAMLICMYIKGYSIIPTIYERGLHV